MAKSGKRRRRAGAERRRPAAWNSRERSRVPWGWLLIAAGVCGLVYTWAAPRTSGVVAPPASVTPSAAASKPVAVGRPGRPASPATPARTRPARRHSGAARASTTGTEAVPLTTVEEPVVLDPSSPAVLLSEGPGAEPRGPSVRAIDVPDRPVRVPAEEFSRNPRASGLAALTFDGNYDDGPADAILAALREADCRATFFITGRFADRYPGAVRRLADAGMEIGNHSWGHPEFTKLSDRQMRDELERTGALLERLTGRRPTLFRPPFGARNARVLDVVAGEGYRTVYWALDSHDARRDITPDGVRDRVLSLIQPGDVVLMHVGSKASAEVLPGILAGLRRKGLRVVTVGELMGAS